MEVSRLGISPLLTLPPRLSSGDTVALLAPASWAEDEWIDQTAQRLTDWGWQVRLGEHLRDRLGYLAGNDSDRLSDLNWAIRDPRVRAIVCVTGGCGSFRLVRGVDADALRADPKPLVGFSDITALHRAWQAAGVISLHGAVAGRRAYTVRDLLLGGTPKMLHTDVDRYGAELTTSGRAIGPLAGGNLEMLARGVGVLDVDLRGRVLLIAPAWGWWIGRSHSSSIPTRSGESSGS